MRGGECRRAQCAAGAVAPRNGWQVTSAAAPMACSRVIVPGTPERNDWKFKLSPTGRATVPSESPWWERDRVACAMGAERRRGLLQRHREQNVQIIVRRVGRPRSWAWLIVTVPSEYLPASVALARDRLRRKLERCGWGWSGRPFSPRTLSPAAPMR